MRYKAKTLREDAHLRKRNYHFARK